MFNVLTGHNKNQHAPMHRSHLQTAQIRREFPHGVLVYCIIVKVCYNILTRINTPACKLVPARYLNRTGKLGTLIGILFLFIFMYFKSWQALTCQLFLLLHMSVSSAQHQVFLLRCYQPKSFSLIHFSSKQKSQPLS